MKLTKPEKSWILYDVANSAFILIMTATIPIFFRSLVDAAGIEVVANHWLVQLLFSKNATLALAGNLASFEALKTSLFALTTTVAIIIVALLAPILGAIADYKDNKRKLFILSLILGVLGCCTLGITEDWSAFLLFIIIARVGYAACNIFYDSMLIDVADNSRMDYISSFGYAWGYVGSCIPFVVGIILIFTTPFALSTAQATQISFLITALWWLLLTLPLLKNVKQTHYLEHNDHVIKESFKRIGITLRKIKKDKKLLYYIIGYFCYIDGVYTIISMSTTYGAEVGIDSTQMVLALLLTQFIAFPFAIMVGKYASKIGSLKLIRFFILIYCFCCVFGYQLDKAWEFWFLACIVGMAQGGIQALSRSYFGKLIPKNESSEYFGFFDIFGKFADFMGPLILAFSASMFGSSRYGIFSLIILFIIGFVLLGKVAKLQAKENLQ